MNQNTLDRNNWSLKATLLLIWGYAAEVLLALAVTVLLFCLLGYQSLTDALKSAATEWSQLTTAFLASAVAAWFTFANLRPSAFGDYLESLGAIEAYSNAFLSSIYVHMLATIALLIGKSFPTDITVAIATFCLMYSIINIVTLLRNASSLMQIYGDFRRIGDKR